MSGLIRDWLVEWAAARPDAEAVVDRGTRWTYAQLEAVTRRIAAALHAEALGEGSRVATLLGDGAVTVAVVHAVRRLGAVLVPLNRRAAPAELAFQLAAAEGAVLVHDPERAGLARAALADRPTVRLLGIAQLLAGTADQSAALAAFRDEVDLEAPATILFTSGTTGRPKGAVLTHGCHVASADAWAVFLEPRRSDRWLACLPLFHVAGLAMVVRASRWGLPLEVHERFDPSAVDRAVEDGVSHLSLVGPTLERLLEVRPDRPVPPTLRAMLLGGGPIQAALVTRACDRGLPVVSTYGLTETASGVAALAAETAAQRPAAAGRPLPGVELRIAVDGRAARPDEVGEIVVRGPMVFAGYAGLPGETARVLRDGWLRTGDLGARDGDGYLTVVDRRDDLFVSGGENVYPAEVEAVLLTHPAVVEAAVVGRPDPRWGAVPVAAIVLGPGAVASDRVLAAHCRARLAGFKVPVAFHRLSALPPTVGGKLLRREVRALLTERST
ncbi:MAG: o-succinylbenzoate--CoA ligase [Chloroflexi bacterium]|nr:o-succinylbenzoate--CoA ligase [Chloroflexota bacterium]